MKDISSFTNEVIGSGIQVNKVFEDLKAVSGDSAHYTCWTDRPIDESSFRSKKTWFEFK